MGQVAMNAPQRDATQPIGEAHQEQPPVQPNAPQSMKLPSGPSTAYPLGYSGGPSVACPINYARGLNNAYLVSYPNGPNMAYQVDPSHMPWDPSAKHLPYLL
jgi:hypothetical protein